MFKADGASMNLYFLHCSMEKQLWDTILTMFGAHWVMPRNLRDLIACWPGALGCLRHVVIWRVILHCLMWCLWWERNLQTFEGKEMAPPDLQFFFFRMLFDWIQVTCPFSFSSFQELIDSCSSYSLLLYYISRFCILPTVVSDMKQTLCVKSFL